MLPTNKPDHARASAMLPFRRPSTTALASGAGKPSFDGSHASISTARTEAALLNSVLSQLNVYWRTKSSSNTDTSIPLRVQSHRLCEVAPAIQRAEGCRHSSAYSRNTA